MAELTFHDIEEIELFVAGENIVIPRLADDLTDHICCDVGNEMQKGLTFTEAFGRVKQKMEAGRLRQIQQEILYAIDSKYRKMKRTMKISGITGTIIFGIAALFRMQHWPFAGYMLVTGAFALAFIFMPSALIVLWKESHSRRKLMLFISGFITGLFFISGTLFKIQHWPAAGTILGLSVLLAVTIFIPSLLLDRFADPANKPKKTVYLLGAAGTILYTAGMLFKIQHWPLSSLLMVSALIILFIVVLPWYTWLSWREDTHVSAKFIFLLTGSLLIAVPGALINLNMSNMYNDGYFPHLDHEQNLSAVISDMNRSILLKYRDSACYPRMELLHDSTSGALGHIAGLQALMIRESEGNRGNAGVYYEPEGRPDRGPAILCSRLTTPFNTLPPEVFLMPGCDSRIELNRVLAGYLNYVTELIAENNPSGFKWLLDPVAYLPDARAGQDKMTLISALHSLEIMKNNLLVVESRALAYIAEQK